MSKAILKVALASAISMLVAPLAFGGSGVYKPGDNGAIVRLHKFSSPTVINGMTLQPAEYRIVARGHELKVEDMNHNVVVETPITWRRVDHRFRATRMDIDKGVLTKIDLGNTREAVLLHNSLSS